MADSVRSLRARLQHAERKLRETEEREAASAGAIRELTEQLGEAEATSNFNRGLYERGRAERIALDDKIKELTSTVEDLRNDLSFHKGAIHSLEAERNQARTIAESYRDQAYPRAPLLPWDARSLEELQEYSPVTRMRR